MAKTRASATKGFQDRIVMVFDFDRTLAAGTIDALLDRLGVKDHEAWRRERLEPMVKEGWDEILAKGRLLAETAAEQGQEITRDLVEEVGRGIEGYPGLAEALEEVRRVGQEASGGAEVEFYILSSGFVDLMLPSPVSQLFKDVWGSSLEWSDGGKLRGVKRSITHSEKSRYLLALAKGRDIGGANEPQDVRQETPQSEWYVPLDQMAYVGDGASDIAAFSVVQEGGGIGIGVDHSGEEGRWEASSHLFEEARVENLVPPDFREGSEMRTSLTLAAGILGRRVALRRMGRGE